MATTKGKFLNGNKVPFIVYSMNYIKHEEETHCLAPKCGRLQMRGA